MKLSEKAVVGTVVVAVSGASTLIEKISNLIRA